MESQVLIEKRLTILSETCNWKLPSYWQLAFQADLFSMESPIHL